MSETPTDPWTIGRLLTWTTDFLKQSGSEQPRLDAEVLLAHAKGCPRIALYAAWHDPADDALRQAFRSLVKQRAEGAPVAYLVGRREFYSLEFRVTRDTLIPRPETELIVVALLDAAKARPEGVASPYNIADIGTGSGILAICAAKNLPNANITAIDISAAALAVASENATTHQVADRIELVESDLFGNIAGDRQYDFVISNPPYIGEGEMAKLARDVRDYEPRGALVAGPKGTEIIERLLPQVAARLRPGGMFYCEISPVVHDAVRALVSNEPTLSLEKSIKDLAGHPRVVVARKK